MASAATPKRVCFAGLGFENGATKSPNFSENAVVHYLVKERARPTSPGSLLPRHYSFEGTKPKRYVNNVAYTSKEATR